MRIGKIAHQYLSNCAAKQNLDKTFSICKNPIDKKYYIENKPIDIREDNLVIGDKEYEGTPGLWELIISKQPDQDIYSQQDLDNYAKILVETSALKQNNNPAEVVPKSSRGLKWRKILSTIWKDRSLYEGQGMDENVVKPILIPGDPNALINRLNVLLASKAAGNTGVRNELITICDELLRHKVMTKPVYKNLMLHMLQINNRKIKKQYVIGGSGILDSIFKFLDITFTSQGAKQINKEVGKAALDARKLLATEAGKN